MAWKIEYVRSAEKQLSRIDRTWQRRILDYMDEVVAGPGDPRERATVLTGNLGGLWRVRVADYRIICSIEETVRVVLVVKIGHRRDVYD